VQGVSRGGLATDREWQALARLDPLYVVAAWPGRRGAWTPEDFYAVGDSDVADAVARWRRYEPSLQGTCVEVGCGAGRMTRSLTGVFEHVIGLDVSEEMLELAAKAAPDAELKLVSGTSIPLPDATADAVFTTHVLQHLDGIERVSDYLREMHRVLKPRGTIMVHLLLGPERPAWRRLAAAARLRATRWALAHGRTVFHYHGERYLPGVVRDRLHQVGFVDVELVEFEMRSNGDPHPFWLARKPGSPDPPRSAAP
jgi:ubiquinone/menaquinone biosynthesis C-methylase UbiE